MAELTPKTINELPEASYLSASDLFVISSGGASKKIPWENVGAVHEIISAQAKTSHNIIVPNASAHLLVYYGGALDTYRILWVACTSGGILDRVDILAGTGNTITHSGNVLTISFPASRNLYLIDIAVYGNDVTSE